MKNGRKQATGILLMAISALLLLALVTGAHMRRQTSEQILRFGMFAGSYWDVPNGNCYEVVDEAIRRFEEKHPGVRVEYTSGVLKADYSEWLAEQIVLGEEPDVFMLPAGEFDMIASLGVLKNLDALIQKDPEFQVSDYYSGVYEYGNIRGIQYALPYESVPTLMFVNRTLLEREGIVMPSENWSWEDFLSVCKKVTKDTDGDGVVDQFGCYDYGWKDAVCSNGVSLFDEEGDSSYFGDPRVEAAVRFVRDLNAVSGGYQVTAKDFDKGNVAFRPFAFSDYRTYKPYPWRIKKYSDFEWDCVQMPAGPEGSSSSELDTLLMGISSRTGKEKLAWDFLKELCHDETTQSRLLEDSQGMPVVRAAVKPETLRKVLGDDNPGTDGMDVKVIQQAMEQGIKSPNFRLYESAMDMADGEISHMIQGDVALDTGLLKLQREVNSLLRQ